MPVCSFNVCISHHHTHNTLHAYWRQSKRVVTCMQRTREDDGVEESGMFGIELCIELCAVERQANLLGSVHSLLKQSPLMAVACVRQQQDVARLQVAVLQCQNSLSTQSCIANFIPPGVPSHSDELNQTLRLSDHVELAPPFAEPYTLGRIPNTLLLPLMLCQLGRTKICTKVRSRPNLEKAHITDCHCKLTNAVIHSDCSTHVVTYAADECISGHDE